MKKEIADLWVAALRSGEYKQCTGTLCRIDPITQEKSFCCLGVLTDLSIKDGVPLSSYLDVDFLIYHMKDSDEKIYGTLHQATQEWAGMNSSAGSLPAKTYLRALWILNDSQNYTFEEISSVIEEHWEYL